MPPAARMADPTTHGSPLAPGPGSANVMIGFMPAWRAMVDQHACPAVSITGPDGVWSEERYKEIMVRAQHRVRKTRSRCQRDPRRVGSVSRTWKPFDWVGGAHACPGIAQGQARRGIR